MNLLVVFNRARMLSLRDRKQKFWGSVNFLLGVCLLSSVFAQPPNDNFALPQAHRKEIGIPY
ncbi:MAG: hypothetical protein AAB354_13720, partial [candidate division KSB1 bacterium]